MAVPATLRALQQYLQYELTKIHPPEEATAMSFVIIESLFCCSRSDILIEKPHPITPGDWAKVKDILFHLKQRRPLQYILGFTTFCNLTIKVAPSVFIPRPETEELVQWFLDSLKPDKPPINILDAGTGSGCIAIAVASADSCINVCGCDHSDEALSVARQNAALNNVAVNFFKMDLMNPSSLAFPEKYFHYILSNPPYIPLSEKGKLQPEVAEFEPDEALFVPNNNPLIFYHAIVSYAEYVLAPGGGIFFESHEHYCAEVSELLKKAGYRSVEIRHDINGKPRMVKAVKKK